MPPRRAVLRRTLLGPVAVSAALVLLAAPAVAALVAAPLAAGQLPVGQQAGIGAGWVLTWLLLGLTAGYALSGSA